MSNTPDIPFNITVDNVPAWIDTSSTSSSLEIDLPVSGCPMLVLVSNGNLKGGSLGIQQGDGSGATVAKVLVVANYSTKSDLANVEVAVVHRNDVSGSKGVGFFGMKNQPAPNVTFAVTFVFPSSTSVLNVNDFESGMGRFSYKVSDLASGVYFKSVTLASSAQPIAVTSLSAQKASVASSNSGNISGTFTASSLTLSTSGASIDATVNLKSTQGNKSLVSISTTQQPITARLNLTADNNNTGGVFEVSGSNSNGPVTLIFNSAPVESKLTLNAATSQEAVNVTLNDTYQGSYSVTTSKNAAASIDPNAKDPSGQGRKRIIDPQTQTQINQSGNVAWSQGDLKLGTVKLSTSRAAATLNA